MTIFPTHHCFDDALDFITARVRQDPAVAESDTLTLVHGIARLPNPDGQLQPGERFAHAWVEEGNHVWAAGVLDGQRIYFRAERDEYYARLRVEQTTRYSILEAWAENRRTCSYGPWKLEYLALCRPRTPDRLDVESPHARHQVRRSSTR